MKQPYLHLEHNVLDHSQVGYALHQLIYDDKGEAIDYRFINTNDRYLELTGFTSDIIGKTLLEVVPDIVNDSTDWVKLYGDISKENKPISFERYSEVIKNWYFIHAHSPKVGYFVVLLTPASESTTLISYGNDTEPTHYRNESLVKMLTYQTENIEDYLDYALSEALKLTKSVIGYIYFYNDKTGIFTLNTWSNKAMESCNIVDKETTYALEHTGFWGEVIRQRKAIINNQFHMPHPNKKGFPEGHSPVNKFMSLPIFNQGHIVAVIGLGNKSEDYNDEDILMIQGFMENVWNIVTRMNTESLLAAEKETLRITLESIGDGVISIDPKGIIQTMNHTLEDLTGWNKEDAIGKHINDVLIIESVKNHEIRNDIADLAMLNTSYSKMNIEVILHSKNGSTCHIADNNAAILTDQGMLKGAVIVIRNIEDEFVNAERIRYMSYHDVLTGLYNRRFFEEEMSRLDTYRQLPISIIMGDVNGLKLTNDVFGHLEGDALLKSAATVIKNACRKEDIIARWGGDEFIILLPKTNRDRAHHICEIIKANCKKADQHIIDVSISLGYGTKEEESTEIEKVLMTAENHMYKHKLTESKSQRSTIIEAIRTSLYERSQETEEHAERLVSFCISIGNQLKLSDDKIDELKLLAILHDIGKIGIPDQILTKPGPLTEEEWFAMKTHPEIGYRIAHASPDLSIIAEGILCHHEKWDGSGYPSGLSGEDIPLLSRIISVADAYDAMISNRSYRKALPPDKAKKELMDCSGSQFDPNIVQVFIHILNEV